MKKNITLPIAIFCLFFYACTSFRPVKVVNGKLLGILPLRENKVTYVDVQEFPGVSDIDLFRQARRWAAFHVRNPKDALEIGDFNTKDIIGSGGMAKVVFRVKRGDFEYLAPEVSYTLTVESYPGKYRITYSSFYLYGTGMEKGKLPLEDSRYAIESGTWTSDRNATEHFRAIDAHVKRMSASLRDFIVDSTGPIETSRKE